MNPPVPQPNNPEPAPQGKRQYIDIEVESIGNHPELPDNLKGYRPFIGVPKKSPPPDGDGPPADNKPAE